LGTPGGTIDLRTGDMRAADPDDHITVLTKVTPAPVGAEAKRWQQFLDDITGNNKDLQRTLQMWFGISATGTSRDQRILFLYGPGGNGKGVLLRTIAGLLGDHAVNAPRDLLMMKKHSQHATHLVDVLYARMAMATEVDDNETWDTALVKNLTGGDSISVNRMHRDPFRALPRCSITISGNHKPALKGIDDAVKRRFLLATFMLKIVKVIADLENELITEEGAAILRWIIDGAVARESAGRLHVAKVIEDATADYFAEENVIEDFIAMWLEKEPVNASEPWKVKTSDVYEKWTAYCGRSRRPAGPQNQFTTSLQAAGVAYKRTNAGRYFVGVHVRSIEKSDG
jgi:putative DNA primase/helicase